MQECKHMYTNTHSWSLSLSSLLTSHLLSYLLFPFPLLSFLTLLSFHLLSAFWKYTIFITVLNTDTAMFRKGLIEPEALYLSIISVIWIPND